MIYYSYKVKMMSLMSQILSAKQGETKPSGHQTWQPALEGQVFPIHHSFHLMNVKEKCAPAEIRTSHKSSNPSTVSVSQHDNMLNLTSIHKWHFLWSIQQDVEVTQAAIKLQMYLALNLCCRVQRIKPEGPWQQIPELHLFHGKYPTHTNIEHVSPWLWGQELQPHLTTTLGHNIDTRAWHSLGWE